MPPNDPQGRTADLIARPEMGSYKGEPQFGQRLQIRPGTSEGAILPVLQADNIPGPPSVITINLSRVGNEQAGNARPVARIDVRCGGITYSFRADWSYGQAISVCADSITVSAEMMTRTSGIAYICDVGFTVVAAFAMGTVPGRVTFTDQQRQLLAGAFSVWQIPPFARSVFFNLSGDAGGSTNNTGCWQDNTLTFATDVGPTVNAQQLGRNIPSFWQLPGSAVFVQANAPVNPVNIVPIWELAL